MKAPKNAIVECGDFSWKGRAKNVNDALIGAFCNALPEHPSILVRACVVSGKPKRDKRRGVWQYIAFESALKIAGYTITKTKKGFEIG